MSPAKRCRIEAAHLAVAAGCSVQDMPELFAACIFFESWIELGGDKTQKRVKLLSEETATLHVISGGKCHGPDAA